MERTENWFHMKPHRPSIYTRKKHMILKKRCIIRHMKNAIRDILFQIFSDPNYIKEDDLGLISFVPKSKIKYVFPKQNRKSTPFLKKKVLILGRFHDFKGVVVRKEMAASNQYPVLTNLVDEGLASDMETVGFINVEKDRINSEMVELQNVRKTLPSQDSLTQTNEVSDLLEECEVRSHELKDEVMRVMSMRRLGNLSG